MDYLEQISGANHTHDIAVDNTLLIVGDGDLAQDFANENSDKYQITILPFISDYSGSLGDFRVEFALDSHKMLGESSVDLPKSSDFMGKTFAQIAFFSESNAPKKPQLGVHFISDYESKDTLCAEISALIGDFSYTKTILFDEKKCQYFHRDKTEFSYCKDCVAVCPTMAISADDTKRELIFSQIDCVLCGKCVAVCPSGAMQKSNATLPNLNKALKFYKGKIAVVCENNDDFTQFSTNLKNAKELPPQDEFAPLILPSINLLNEASLLSILQESGRVCVILGELDSRLKECVEFVNEIYTRIVGQKAIFISESSANMDTNVDKSNLDSNAFSALDSQLPYYHYEISNDDFMREIVANRVRFLVKESDFGVLKNSANLIYTDLKIDTTKCTLCNACVESCNAKALISAKDSFTLLLNPSLCTACGYCIDTCAEKCLEMSLSGYQLNETFLNHRVLAQDEPFKCVECGTIFATNKSIQKIKNILTPAFMGDIIKLKSLECCEKCKVKIMFEKSTNFVGGAN